MNVLYTLNKIEPTLVLYYIHRKKKGSFFIWLYLDNY